MPTFAIKLDESLAVGFSRQLGALARANQAPAASCLLLEHAARAVSRATSSGQTCLLLGELLGSDEESAWHQARASLLASTLVATEETKTPLPLVLDRAGRLYLGRYFAYEKDLAALLMARAQAGTGRPAMAGAEAALLGQVFPAPTPGAEGKADWQRLAAAMALRQRLTIITGGPGTGKTTTVVNLLACLLAQNSKLRIALAAPTGKAAQRMQDAIRERAIHLPEHLRGLLPTESFTIHRLLGVIPDSHLFRHHAENLLALDCLIIDEASMLDLALATKLVAAVPPAARLILLGDKDQLSAVEAGAVFGELCSDPTISAAGRQDLAALTGIAPELITPPTVSQRSPLPDAVIWLTDNYRFGKDSSVGQLAHAINRQDIGATLACLREEGDNGVRWVADGGTALDPAALAQLGAGFDDYRRSVSHPGLDPSAVFAAWGRFRILGAVRDSERGIDWLNGYLATRFRQQLHHPLDDGHSQWYPGRPVMILRNDYVLKLFNGDIGIILPTASGQLLAHFPALGDEFRLLDPVRLPPHQTAFAMTVHKSQGSEFEQVALVLPAYASQVLTKELIYTAVTRARHQVTIYSSPEVLSEAISRQYRRHSGLIARMQEGLLART